VLNGLKVVGKKIGQVKLACSGAGAAALACLDLLVSLGLRLENIQVADLGGVLHTGRTDSMDPNKARYARETRARTLAEIVSGADIFLGLSAARVLTPEAVTSMAPRPLILALANPEPEILPEEARRVRPDAILATGRSDYPNQVNNVLCFPFIFRGALDVGATTINEAMKLAAVRAIAGLAEAELSDVVAAAYSDAPARFGPDYLIPRPFDPRLILEVAPAVALAAMESGVAARPIRDFAAYRQQLQEFVYHSGLIMRPVFTAAKREPKRLVYAEGEDERVLRAVQIVIDEGLAQPILIGRPDVIEQRIKAMGLRLVPGQNCEVVNPDRNPRFTEAYTTYFRLLERDGVTLEQARQEVRRNTTLLGAMLVRFGDADAMLCGTYDAYAPHLRAVSQVIGLRKGVNTFAAMNMLILPGRTLFICDTYVHPDPSAEQVAEMAVLAAEEVRRFGIEPRVALLSHSNFGSADTASARKMREALRLITQRAPNLEAEGEMHGDAALSATVQHQVFPNTRLKGAANLLVMPTLDAASIAFNLLKTTAGDGITVGPILLGAASAVHILTPTASVRRIVNMSALAVVDAASQRAETPPSP
jgi:malate dehydrogenase (oxaloacetate-decarboxylating)(NADP+)